MIEAFRSTENLLQTSDTRLRDIATQIHKEGVAVFYDQKFTEDDIIAMQKRFGECETPDLFMNPKKYPELFLVTGKRDDN